MHNPELITDIKKFVKVYPSLDQEQRIMRLNSFCAIFDLEQVDDYDWNNEQKCYNKLCKKINELSKDSQQKSTSSL